MSRQAPTGQLATASQVLLRVVATVSALVGLLAVVTLVIRGITASSRTTVTVNDMTLVNSQTPPFTQDLPGLRAYYSSLNLEISDAPRSMVWLDFAQQAVGGVGFIALCAVLVWLCRATLRGRPFVTTAPFVLVGSGLALVAASITSDVLAGRMQAAVVDLYGVDSTGGYSAAGGAGEGFGVGTSVQLGGLGMAAALCVLGVTFALGNRLQRDTDRLI